MFKYAIVNFHLMSFKWVIFTWILPFLNITATMQPFYKGIVGLTSLVTVAKEAFLLRIFVFKHL